ncbi:type II secretory pathway pseudopilin PulG [Nitrosospira sp. Nsp5]|uniref:Type II secretory pathway, pseudopilin PulG n=1 Tax=Nitrosospira multiformis TaxID=1231 RepID=A0ABY0T930_9PROT|nr:MULTISPECIES: type II secretion system GspH family protein [Nitrosospira]PTR08015.1 type II secretory pathway pseudopilin PulG [Nitrosospira sp. Nsp5]SDQ46799.1 Type II secretory pathway, pseudopilin PulG [Nitrosospira multiformis]
MATGRHTFVRHQQGFTYLGLLMFIIISGIALASTGQVWHAEAQREKERELLFIGEQFRKAIGSYYENTPGGVKHYPLTLQDLLDDKRFVKTRHHLRRIYRDPITRTVQWGLVREQGRITGVHSLSTAKPFKRDGFLREFVDFTNAEEYTDWRFIYTQNAAALSAIAATQPGNAGTPPSGPARPNPSGPSGPVAPAKPGNRFALCGSQLTIANAQCRESCGDLTGPACHACFDAASDARRACLRN